MVKVTATEIERFADSHLSGYVLPGLVHGLIRATTHVERIDMPSGDGAQRPGPDGRLRGAAGNAWVPTGDSVWELGTSKRIKKKADEDFRKRNEGGLPGVDRATTTFVLVTARRWDGKHAWEAEKAKAGPWRSVRVLDADNLENWLAEAPRVALEFAAEHLNRPDAVAEWRCPQDNNLTLREPMIGSNRRRKVGLSAFPFSGIDSCGQEEDAVGARLDQLDPTMGSGVFLRERLEALSTQLRPQPKGPFQIVGNKPELYVIRPCGGQDIAFALVCQWGLPWDAASGRISSYDLIISNPPFQKHDLEMRSGGRLGTRIKNHGAHP